MQSNLLSFTGTLFSSLDLYTQLYNSEHFQEFTKHISKDTPKEVTYEFIKNFILRYTDSTFQKYIEDPELNKVFMLENMSAETKSKLFIGKVLNLFYDEVTNLDLVSEDNFIGNIYLLLFFELLGIDKQKFIKFFMEIMTEDDDINFNQVTNGREVYTILINYFSKVFAEVLHGSLSLFTEQLDGDPVVPLKTFMESCNNVFNYKSSLFDTCLIEQLKNPSCNDESEDSSDSDGDTHDHKNENNKRDHTSNDNPSKKNRS